MLFRSLEIKKFIKNRKWQTDENESNREKLQTIISKSTDKTEVGDNQRQTPIQAIRIATLGRMSEIELIDWTILTKDDVNDLKFTEEMIGRSYYKIGKTRLPEK